MNAAPWQQQPLESSRAFAAFVAYRDQAPARRSMRVAWRTHSGYEAATEVPGQWRVWAKRWQWQERVLAWDAEQDRLRRHAQEDAVRAMAERHARVALGFQDKLIVRLATMDVSEIAARDMPRWLWISCLVERQALLLATTLHRRKTNRAQDQPAPIPSDFDLEHFRQELRNALGVDDAVDGDDAVTSSVA